MTLDDNVYNLFVNEPRYILGMKLFNSCNWYRAHDIFEEIWHETIGPERLTLQGILQIAVAQVHLENGNINGANVGQQAPDFNLDIVANGNGNFQLSDHLGSVVVMAFFSPN